MYPRNYGVPAHFSQVFLRFSRVTAIIVSFHSLKDSLHFLGLAFPFFVAHLGFTTEKLIIGFAVATAQSVPQSGELSIVVVEVKMMHSVASSTIDNGTIRDIFTVVDEDSPKVDEAEQEDVGEFLQRENEGKDVVWNTLGPAIQRVESMGRIRTWHDPLVVRLV